MLQSSQEFHRKLTPGRVVQTHTTLFHSALAVVLEHRVAESSPMCTMLMLASTQETSGMDEKSLVVSQEVVMPYNTSCDIYMPKGVCAHVIVKLPIKCISGITDIVLKIDVKEILADHRRRSTPPYRYCVMCVSVVFVMLSGCGYSFLFNRHYCTGIVRVLHSSCCNICRLVSLIFCELPFGSLL